MRRKIRNEKVCVAGKRLCAWKNCRGPVRKIGLSRKKEEKETEPGSAVEREKRGRLYIIFGNEVVEISCPGAVCAWSLPVTGRLTSYAWVVSELGWDGEGTRRSTAIWQLASGWATTKEVDGNNSDLVGWSWEEHNDKI